MIVNKKNRLSILSLDPKMMYNWEKSEYLFKRILILLMTVMLQSLSVLPVGAQQSVARQWNEMLLEAIRNDFARPTVHARNLFHTSIAMFDAWAVYDDKARPYLLGNQVESFKSEFSGIPAPSDVMLAQNQAISFAAYRLLKHRFANSPGSKESLMRFDSLMNELGYDVMNTGLDYQMGSAAALGNFIGQTLIDFGAQDGSNEILDYKNLVYFPFNGFLNPTLPGTQGINDPNRWQPLTFEFFIDQAGFEIPGGIPEFLSPEWGNVIPFALRESDKTTYQRNGDVYYVYHDPGPPAFLSSDGSGTSAEYIWGHSLVAVWSSHLDVSDGIMMDISPASIGNIESYPKTIQGLRNFYNLEDGGDPSRGHALNPHTGQPYEPQIVPRGDYARVLAEFWADGPDSETPPGHWYTILNYVNDHPQLIKKFQGKGDILSDLEWDIKAYFVLGGALHDAAIAAWSIKGWYDYIRPISAFRYMAEKGQSSDSTLANYSPEGLQLIPGFIEMIGEGDSLAGDQNQHLNKIKVYAWRGPESIYDPRIHVGGVGWILAEEWWPFQRPTFVTPPFAGYVSGHSTFSRAAAEVMTMLTGDPFFPGGMGEFYAEKDEFLVFEDGPSIDITLQWATYRDASDQTSLSRIWGGIHPPVDDIPGRLIGEKVGQAAFDHAMEYIGEQTTATKDEILQTKIRVFPNPVSQEGIIYVDLVALEDSNPFSWRLLDIFGRPVIRWRKSSRKNLQMAGHEIEPGMYLLEFQSQQFHQTIRIVVH